MTDKQIIIDGVNVREWTDEEIRYNFEKHSPKAIRQIAFDLYKQLKRKGQECEELESDLTDLSKIIDCKNGTILTFKEQLDQLKAENEKLKHDNGYEVGALEKTIDNLVAENGKLKQTLTEIKDMLKDICIEECNFDWNKTSKKHCGDCDCRYSQILQKISECKGEYNEKIR